MTEDDKALVERLDGWARDAFEGRKLICGYRDILWAVERIQALSAENERLRRDHAALAKQLDIAQRKLKGVTKQWHADRASLGETK